MTTPDALDALFAARLAPIAEILKRELAGARIVRATLAPPASVDRDTVGVAPAGGGFTPARVVAAPAGVAIERPAVQPVVRLTAEVLLDAATLADGPRLRAELAGLCRKFGQAEDAVLLHGTSGQAGLLAGSKPGLVWSGASNRAPVSSALTELRGGHVGAVDLLLPAWAMPRLDADPPRRDWLAQQAGGTVAGCQALSTHAVLVPHANAFVELIEARPVTLSWERAGDAVSVTLQGASAMRCRTDLAVPRPIRLQLGRMWLRH